MSKARVFDLFLFVASLAIAFIHAHAVVLDATYIKALLLYTIFSSIYFQLRIVTRSGNSTIDYAISYTSSFGIFAGPLGTFLFETVYRFIVYFYKRKQKPTIPESCWIPSIISARSHWADLLRTICIRRSLPWRTSFRSDTGCCSCLWSASQPCCPPPSWC